MPSPSSRRCVAGEPPTSRQGTDTTPKQIKPAWGVRGTRPGTHQAPQSARASWWLSKGRHRMCRCAAANNTDVPVSAPHTSKSDNGITGPTRTPRRLTKETGKTVTDDILLTQGQAELKFCITTILPTHFHLRYINDFWGGQEDLRRNM